MNQTLTLRIFCTAAAVLVTAVSLSDIAGDIRQPSSLPVPTLHSVSTVSADQIERAESASQLAPFRSDLTAQYGSALAAQALVAPSVATFQSNQFAQRVISIALKEGPHQSETWLVLAALRAELPEADRRDITRALKMSYLTGPTRKELVLPRLEIATSSDVLADEELRGLATSDIRSVFLRFKDQIPQLISVYLHASQIGRQFIEETVQAIDPSLLQEFYRHKSPSN